MSCIDDRCLYLLLWKISKNKQIDHPLVPHSILISRLLEGPRLGSRWLRWGSGSPTDMARCIVEIIERWDWCSGITFYFIDGLPSNLRFYSTMQWRRRSWSFGMIVVFVAEKWMSKIPWLFRQQHREMCCFFVFCDAVVRGAWSVMCDVRAWYGWVQWWLMWCQCIVRYNTKYYMGTSCVHLMYYLVKWISCHFYPILIFLQDHFYGIFVNKFT